MYLVKQAVSNTYIIGNIIEEIWKGFSIDTDISNSLIQSKHFHCIQYHRWIFIVGDKSIDGQCILNT